MFVQKAFIEDLKGQIKALQDDNHRLMNTICQLVGISTPFPVIQPHAPAITVGRKSWPVRQRELEAKEANAN
jgi:hypothetical protein